MHKHEGLGIATHLELPVGKDRQGVVGNGAAPAEENTFTLGGIVNAARDVQTTTNGGSRPLDQYWSTSNIESRCLRPTLTELLSFVLSAAASA